MKNQWFTVMRGITALVIAAIVIGVSTASAWAQRPSPGRPGNPLSQGECGGQNHGRPQQGEAPTRPLETVAQTLGMSVDELRAALQGGKTVADLAQEKGVALETVVNAILAERKTQLDQAVAAGRMTQEQADAILAKLQTELPTRLTQPFQAGEQCGRPQGSQGHGRPQQGGDHTALLDLVAQTLTMSTEELRTALQGGATVADLAAEKGVALDTLVNVIVAERKVQLDQAVAEGRMTQEQADTILAKLRENLPTRLSQPFSGRLGMGTSGDAADADAALAGQEMNLLERVAAVFLPLMQR